MADEDIYAEDFEEETLARPECKTACENICEEKLVKEAKDTETMNCPIENSIKFKIPASNKGFSKIVKIEPVPSKAHEISGREITKPLASREDTTRELTNLLFQAANKIERERKHSQQCARRSVPISHIRSGLAVSDIRQIATNSSQFRVQEYDPDFDEALLMKSKAEVNPYRSEEVNNSTPLPGETKRSSDYASRKSKSMEVGDVDLQEMNQNADLLRIGVDRSVLSSKAQSIYGEFLSDLIAACRQRASGCNSTEELAMHQALAEYIRESCFPADKISVVLDRMVSKAVQGSLRS